MINKKGQEEVMGFVLIVLIIIIIGVVFFAFSLRKSGESVWQKSSEADDFLNSILAYTTDCKPSSGGAYLSVKELVRECADKSSTQYTCGDITSSACKAANSTISAIFKELQADVSDRPVHGYNLTVTNAPSIAVAIGNQNGSSFISSVSIPLGPPSFDDAEVKMRCWYPRNSTA